ncbi:MAG: dihydrodipicolinate synthase family protein, partial [Mariniphaga sp.]
MSDNKLDEAGLERLLNHLLNGGVHGLFLLGTTGEGTSLNYTLRRELVKKACRLVNKKVPVLAGITDTVFENSLQMAEAYKDAGADMLVVAPPCYNPMSQDEIRHYLDDLAPRLPLPFLLYNIPSHTKNSLSVELVKHASELDATGIKDSSGDITHILALVEAFKDSADFAILTGTETLISDTLSCGGHGAVPGGA